MSSIGFVYVLANEHMPNVFKIGCTERSPHARAAELSNHTGVPSAFRVVCYIEVPDFQAVEKRIHAFGAQYRINPNREFFSEIRWVIEYLYWCPTELAFTDATEKSLPWDRLLCLLGDEHGDWDDLSDLWNPWGEKDDEERRAAEVKKRREAAYAEILQRAQEAHEKKAASSSISEWATEQVAATLTADTGGDA